MKKEPEKEPELQKALNELYKNLDIVSKFLSDDKVKDILKQAVEGEVNGEV